MAFVICCVFFTLVMRLRKSFALAISSVSLGAENRVELFERLFQARLQLIVDLSR
jgi:hypothetical protein